MTGCKGRGHVGLLAEGREVAPGGLAADHATPAGDGVMDEFQAPFTALILEPGAHLAAFHLTVAVIGMGHPQTRPLKPGQRLPVLAAQIPAALLHIDIGSTMVVVIVIVIVIVIMVMPMPAAMPVGPMGVAIGMFMGQQAVFAVLLTVGQAKKAPLANPAEPQRGGVRFVERPV